MHMHMTRERSPGPPRSVINRVAVRASRARTQAFMGGGASKNQVAPATGGGGDITKLRAAILQKCADEKKIFDVHCHYTTYMQQSEGIGPLTKAMDKNGIGYAALCGSAWRCLRIQMLAAPSSACAVLSPSVSDAMPMPAPQPHLRRLGSGALPTHHPCITFTMTVTSTTTLLATATCTVTSTLQRRRVGSRPLHGSR